MAKNKLAKIAFFSATTITTIHVVNRIMNYLAVSKDVLTTKPGEFYDWKYGKVYYEQHGEGSPLLLLHSLEVGGNADEWSHIVSQLAKKHTVYTVDLPGCGRSEKSLTTYTNFVYIRFLADFINAVICEPTAMIANAESCPLAMMLHKYNPTFISDLTLVNPPSIKEASQSVTFIDKLKKWILDTPILGSLLYQLHYRENMISKRLAADGFYDARLIPSNFIASYYKGTHLGKSQGRFLASSIDAHYIHVPLAKLVQELPENTRVLLGTFHKNANCISKEYLLYYSNISTKLIPNTKKYPHFEAPAEFLRKLN